MTSERRVYSVAEIMKMRQSVSSYEPSLFNVPFRAGQRERIIEDMLLTYISQGIEPEDLEAALIAEMEKYHDDEEGYDD